MSQNQKKVLYIDSNFAINENNKNSHAIVIHDNYSYWWKRNNLKSTKYVCSNQSCYASLSIKNDQVEKLNGKHYHDKLTEEEIQILIAKQKMKKAVLNDLTKTAAGHYKEMENKLLEAKIPARIIASNMPAFKQMSSGLQKIRSKNVPATPKDFNDLEINGDYALTSNKCEFLRYDNKSKTDRIIIFVDDQSMKILSESDEWFMDGTFKSAPKQLMQLFTLHASIKSQNSSIDTSILSCVYILTQRRSKNTYKEIFNVLKDIAYKNNLSLNPKKNESITDRSPLRKMREAKRQEEIQIQNRITERINCITKDEIDSEVKRFWEQSKNQNRSRISKTDREAAKKRLAKIITDEEQKKKAY